MSLACRSICIISRQSFSSLTKMDDLNLLRLLESRIGEILQIEKEVKKKHPKLFHQRLPKFMRRRAASHNIKRIPKTRRPTKLDTKDRKKLLAFRRKERHLKNKRILYRHGKQCPKDENKSLMHKWFAKRFKIERSKPGLEQVPIKNNTKNQRSLYRQTLYGCAYLSMAHLVAIKVENLCDATTDTLNCLTKPLSGFTFSARALESENYQVLIHLFTPNTQEEQEIHANRVIEMYKKKSAQMVLNLVPPCEWLRLRLVGPLARESALRIVENPDKHRQAIDKAEQRLLLSHQWGTTLGRRVEDSNASYVYYFTSPLVVDVTFRNTASRTLWHKLVKNKAHLVGGKRDMDTLFAVH